MKTIALSLDEIYTLAKQVLLSNGCNEENAEVVAKTVTFAERDGSVSHGLFRIPGYIAALRSKRVKGNSRPTIHYRTQNAIRVDGEYAFAPMPIKVIGAAIRA